tara:strand:- start:521 stop:1660 length:1140 start_codon:yes stop_codon:yes gene_type:complete
MSAPLADSLRAIAAKLLAAKQSGAAAPAGLAEEGSALLMEMHQKEQVVLDEVGTQAAETGAAKRKMEDSEAQLHGLRYHKQRCVRGLAECHEMTPQLPAGLVTEPELKLLAPELPPAESAHQLQLQRLAVEYKERNRLRDSLDAAKSLKAERSDQAAKRKSLNASVATQLDGIISAATTLQERLPPLPTPSKNMRQDALAPLLPAPLYTLWHGAAAYLEAWRAAGKLVVAGDEAAAKLLQSEAAAAAGEPGEAAQSVFAAHPLRVTLQLEGSKIEVAFSYHAQLQMIGVSAKPAAAAAKLASLFSADDGSGFPDERCALRALSRLDTASASPPALTPMLPAKPYKWAQWLAGLGPVVAADAPAPPSFQKVMDALLELRK